VALQAQTLVILSNVPGLLRTFPDESSLIPRIEAGAVREYLDRYAHGRMKRKMLGSLDAVQGGVGQVVIADGRVDAPLQRALNGAGTVIR
jgi:acetylglutamate/LysW-gamma-L-alpha-aminoadipate kinase